MTASLEITTTARADDDVDIDSSATISRGKAPNRLFIFAKVTLFVCLIVGVVTYNTPSFVSKNIYDAAMTSTTKDDRDNEVEGPSSSSSASSKKRKMSGLERLLESEPEPSDESALIAKIAEKLKPSTIRFIGDTDKEDGADTVKDGEIETITTQKKKQTMVPHQFLHLHHMKTGGTSIDHLLRCATKRLEKEANYTVPYYSIHECSRSRFSQCLSQQDNVCRSSMDTAAVMSYCSALKYLDEFGWWYNKNEKQNIKAFTVLRNPVDRVWSMFRFQTKNCYKCTPLKDIYKAIDSGKKDNGFDQLCTDQLQNHEVNNLLSSEWPLKASEVRGDDKDDDNNAETRNAMIQEAINNMKGFFTVIGITEELEMTAQLLGKVMPWMSDTIDEELYGGEMKSTCPLSHENASPKNNRCGSDGKSHWDLPKQPDQETYDLIVKHNSLDMELYEAAVSYFELQKRALDLSNE
jgi:hypothetical protein